MKLDNNLSIIYKEAEEGQLPDFDMAPGHLEIYVSLNTGQGADRVFEFEALDWSNCVDWMQEGVGIGYWLTEMSGVVDLLTDGYTYIFHDIEVTFYRGDGWTTDDDEEWEFGTLERVWHPWTWCKQKLFNAWWLTLGYRIRNWKGANS